MLNVEQLQNDFGRKIERLMKYTHVFEWDLKAIEKACADVYLSAELKDGYVYISGYVMGEPVENALEVIYA